MKGKIIKTIIGLIVAAFLYYIILPPINPTAISFWFYLALLAIMYFVLNISNVEYL